MDNVTLFTVNLKKESGWKTLQEKMHRNNAPISVYFHGRYRLIILSRIIKMTVKASVFGAQWACVRTPLAFPQLHPAAASISWCRTQGLETHTLVHSIDCLPSTFCREVSFCLSHSHTGEPCKHTQAGTKLRHPLEGLALWHLVHCSFKKSAVLKSKLALWSLF